LRKRILLLGGSGQLGHTIKNIFSNYIIISPSSNKLNITRKTDLEFFIKKIKPNFIINTAAYTNVEKAEIDKKKCLKVNSTSLKIISELSKKYKIFLVHISSDYVFSRKKKTPINENSKRNPINFYGYSKLLAEEIIEKSHCNYVIFRTSWLYSYKFVNFPNKILNFIKENKKIKVINDQHGSLTSCELLSKIIFKVLNLGNTNMKETFNLSCNGSSTWFDISKYILKYCKKNKLCNQNLNIIPIKSNAYKTLCKRPKYSYLSKKKIEKFLKIKLPNWKNDLKDNFFQNI